MESVATNGHGAIARLEKWKEEVDTRLGPPPKPSSWLLRRMVRLKDLAGGKPKDDQVIRPCCQCKEPCGCNASIIARAEAGLDDVPTKTVNGGNGEIVTLRGSRYSGVLCSPCSAKAPHNWEPSDPIPADKPDLTEAARVEALHADGRDLALLRELERQKDSAPLPGSKLGSKGTVWGKADRT